MAADDGCKSASSSLVDAFGSATTPLERFTLMLAERIGSLEDALHELVRMTSDLHAETTTDFLRGSIRLHETKSTMHLDSPEILRTIAASARKVDRVIVERAWAISCRYPMEPYVTVILKLKDRVSDRRVSSQISVEVADGLGVDVFDVRGWDALTASDKDDVIRYANPGSEVYDVSFPDGGFATTGKETV
jgi:hypothetical protein